jgi:hypothetical protein
MDSRLPRWWFVTACLISVVFVGWMKISPYFDGKALRHPGERMGAVLLVLVLALFFLAWSLVVIGFFAGVRRLIKSRRVDWVYFAGAGLLVGLMFFPGNYYLTGIEERLLPLDEPRYLEFAQQVRALSEKENNTYIDLRVLEHSSESSSDKMRAEKFLEIVKSSVVADWPRSLLQVRVETDSVILSRGGGMLGMMGVEIFDRGPVRALRGPESGRENIYLPIEYPLSSKVFFYMSD